MPSNSKEYAAQWYQKNREKILAKQLVNRRNENPFPRKYFNFTVEEEMVIAERLLCTSATTRSIAQEYGCSDSVIKKILRKHATPEQRIVAKCRKQSNSIRGRKTNRVRQPLDPQKSRSRVRLNRAVKSGKLIRPASCQHPGCENSGRIEAHHWMGYSDEHALDVVWLCPKHHRRADYHPEEWIVEFQSVRFEVVK